MATSNPIITAEAVVLAINAAIKLGDNAQKAYIHRIKNQHLPLPLPGIDFNPPIVEMYTFFKKPENAAYLDEEEGLKVLQEKAAKKPPNFSEEELYDYQRFYYNFNPESSPLGKESLESRLKKSGRGRKKAGGSIIGVVAGSLVEIGIDYFKQTPGALSPESVQGQLMRSFLDALDGISLTGNPKLKEEIGKKMVPRLFSAAAESVASLSTRIAADEKVQGFIRATASGIANDIAQRAAQANDEAEQDEVVRWGQVLLRSMVQNASDYALASPQGLLGTNQVVSEIIESSGRVLLEAILADDADGLKLRRALSQESLNQIAQAALAVIAEHPNAISKQAGVKAIISGVAAAVKDEDFLAQGFLPELIRIVLAQSAGRLELLWRETPDGPEHLLVLAANQVLDILSVRRDDGPWKPVLTKNNLLSILEELLGQVSNNPAWILDEVNGQSVMAEVIEEVFSALRVLPEGERLSAEVLRYVIRLALHVALANPRVLGKVKWGTEAQESAVLSKALELVFAHVFPQDAPPAVNRLNLMMELLEFVTETILRQYPDKRGLILIRLILFEQSGLDHGQGFRSETAQQLIVAAAAVLAEHPSLLVQDEALQRLVTDLAEAVRTSGLQRPALLPELLRLTLAHSVGSLEMLWDAEKLVAKHILVLAASQTLSALAQADETGKWKLHFSDQHVIEIVQIVYEAVLANPRWVRQEALISKLLEAVLAAWQEAPGDLVLTPMLLRELIGLSFGASNRQRELLNALQLPEAKGKLMLQYALERLLHILFKEDYTDEEEVWYLSQRPVLRVLVEHYLAYLTGHPFKEENLTMADEQVQMALAMWKTGFSQDISEVLSKLRYIFLNPPGMEEQEHSRPLADKTVVG